MTAGGVRTRAAREFRHFLAIAGYLYVCFGALILLKSAVLQGHGFEPAPWGFALVKAALLAKFMMVGQALGLGRRFADRPLIWAILHRAVVFLLLLVALSVAEHIVAGLFHGRGVVRSLQEMGGGTAFEAGATVLVLLLILLPYFAFRVLAEALGHDRLMRMLFVERGEAPTAKGQSS